MANLASILRNKMRMLREDAAAVAKVVEDAFRGGDGVEDDDLDAQMRQLFYDLQDAEILAVKRREYSCEGRLMRGYTWQIKPYDGLVKDAPLRKTSEPDLYAELPTQAWQSRRRD